MPTLTIHTNDGAPTIEIDMPDAKIGKFMEDLIESKFKANAPSKPVCVVDANTIYFIEPHTISRFHITTVGDAQLGFDYKAIIDK